MGIYSVHIKGSPDEPSAFERAVFVREGFSWLAFLLGPFWLIWTRAWFVLLAWIMLQITLAYLVYAQILPIMTQSLVDFIVALALGFEASSVRRFALGRRGFQMIDLVHERQCADAERRFFSRWALLNRNASSQASTVNAVPNLVGLFPSAGA